MNNDAVDRMYHAISDILDGEEYEDVMIVLGALHNSLTLHETLDEARIRALYGMMADAAVAMAVLEQDDRLHEFQATEETDETEEGATKGSKTGDEPGPFGTH